MILLCLYNCNYNTQTKTFLMQKFLGVFLPQNLWFCFKAIKTSFFVLITMSYYY